MGWKERRDALQTNNYARDEFVAIYNHLTGDTPQDTSGSTRQSGSFRLGGLLQVSGAVQVTGTYNQIGDMTVVGNITATTMSVVVDSISSGNTFIGDSLADNLIITGTMTHTGSGVYYQNSGDYQITSSDINASTSNDQSYRGDNMMFSGVVTTLGGNQVTASADAGIELNAWRSNPTMSSIHMRFTGIHVDGPLRLRGADPEGLGYPSGGLIMASSSLIPNATSGGDVGEFRWAQSGATAYLYLKTGSFATGGWLAFTGSTVV